MKTLADVWELLSLDERKQILKFVNSHTKFQGNAHMGMMPLISLKYLFDVIGCMDLNGIKYWQEHYRHIADNTLSGALVIAEILNRKGQHDTGLQINTGTDRLDN